MITKWNKLLLATGLLALTLPTQAAVIIHARPYLGFGYGWGYGAYWGGPYYGRPAYFPSHPHQGQVKFDTNKKDAQVFIDGAFAGTVKEVNSAWLREGAHEVELRNGSSEVFDQKIFIASGKTTHVRPDTAPATR